MGMDRMAALQGFSAQVLGHHRFAVTPASADASFRRYFRLTGDGQTWIVMDAPPHKEKLEPFVRIATKLDEIGLNVPGIIGCDFTQGFCVLTDLGERPYLNELRPDTVERLYGDALGALVVLQTGTFLDPAFLPPYSREMLLAEMELFRTWYLGRHLGIRLSDQESLMLSAAFAGLADAALQQPQVWVHRDFHSRNLMIDTRHNPGILDFQDAVRGPITYDLVSLLRDCYVAWPRDQVTDWVKGYCVLSRESGLHDMEDEERFVEWFDRMGVQRHLKVAGIFARLHHRDGKSGYLADLPLTLRYLEEATALYSDLRPLHEFLLALPHR